MFSQAPAPVKAPLAVMDEFDYPIADSARNSMVEPLNRDFQDYLKTSGGPSPRSSGTNGRQFRVDLKTNINFILASRRLIVILYTRYY